MSKLKRYNSPAIAAALLLAINLSASATEPGDVQAQAQAVVRNVQGGATQAGIRALQNQQLEDRVPADAQRQAMRVLIGGSAAGDSLHAAQVAAHAIGSVHLASARTSVHGDAQTMAGQLLSGRAPD